MENKAITSIEDSSIEALFDETCERLWEKQVQYSVQKIKEMDEELLRIENELNVIIDLKFEIKQT